MIIRTNSRSISRITSRFLARSIAAWLAMQTAHGANGTWLGAASGTGAWSNAANWAGGIVPGSTASTTNADTVTFSTAVGSFGGAGNPILIDVSRNMKNITFTGAAANYVVGTTGGSAVTLTAGGTIQLSALTSTNATETINAPLLLQGVATFANNSANGSGAGAGTLNFGGGITFGPSSTWTLSGTNTNANTVSGVVANGPATAVTLVKSGSGSWALTGMNTFNATVQINEGTLAINSIADGGVVSALGAGNGAISLGTGTTAAKLQFTGAGGGSSNRAFSIGLAGGTIENAVAGQTLSLSGAVGLASTLPGTGSLQLTGAGNGVISGVISNSLAPTKSGAGTWTLSGTNSYTGTTAISGGTLKVGNARALGFGGTQTNTTGGTAVASGATLDLNGTAGINEPITVNGTGVSGNGALINSSSTAASIGSGIAGLALPASGFGTALRTVPAVVISGTGSGATATASLGITTASISSVAGGTGWVTGDTVSISGGGGRGAVGVVTASGGAIRSITITNPGFGFTTAPTSISKLVSTAGTGGTMVGNANNFTVGGLTLTNAGTGYTGTPLITIGGTVATVTPTLSSVNLATDSSVGGSGDLVIQAAVSGAGLTKVGAGTLTLTGANVYTGNTTVTQGTLALGNVNAIQSSTLDTGTAGTQSVTFTTAGTNTYNVGGLKGANDLALGGNSLAVGANGQDTNFSGTLSGVASKLTKVGAGTLTLTGANGHTGDTLVTQGTLALGNVNALQSSTLDTGTAGTQSVTFTAAGTNTYNVGGLKGADNLALGGNSLAVGSNGQSTAYTGVLSGIASKLTKVGTGTLTLSGTDTYSGDTTIHAGTLKLDLSGSISNSATIVVGDTGSAGVHLDVSTKTGGLTIGPAQTLKGIGQIDGNTTIQGAHAPGNSPGVETFNGNLAYSTGSVLDWELATNSGGTRGTDFDGINVTGAGALSIAAGVTANLIFNSAGSTVDWNNVFWFSNHSWLVFDGANSPSLASSAIFDTVNVSKDAFGTTLTNGIFAWNELGSDVYLNFTAVPEPASLGTLTALGLLGIGTLRRKRNARR